MWPMLTEKRNEESRQIHQMSTLNILRLMNEQDASVAAVVKETLTEVELAVEAMVSAVENGGSVLYVGAGTSGRLGVLDASECPPTFGVEPTVIKGVIAGGDSALRVAIENAEDNPDLGAHDVDTSAQPGDVVVGIASSGQTPYVLGAVKRARERGLETIGISCNDDTKLSHQVDIAIELPVGPEVVTGSTRLKAGTAQKMVLNMLSTATMIKTGKVYDNLMINLQATNEKLRKRSISIIQELTDVSEAEASSIHNEADGNTRVAILMGMFQIERNQAEADLQKHQGNFVKTLHALQRR